MKQDEAAESHGTAWSMALTATQKAFIQLCLSSAEVRNRSAGSRYSVLEEA